MENLKLYEQYSEERKMILESKVKKNLMHDLLGVPEGDKISSVYKSGKKLASDLVNALKSSKKYPLNKIKSKASSMLAFAANWPNDGENSIFDVALKELKRIQI